MTNPDCNKCGKMMSKGWIDGFITKYSCRHCYEEEKALIEKEFDVLPHQYSYPTHQIQALKEKYNITN